MENETEISTPEQTSNADTLPQVEPEAEQTISDTSTSQPACDEKTAETETDEPTSNDVQASQQAQSEQDLAQETQEPKLYAGKYKSVDELVKGYTEAQKFISKAGELEKKYNELLQNHEKEAQKAEEEKLQAEAKQKEMEQMKELALALNEDYSEFLSDIHSNKGKEQALKLLCNTGLMNSKEDMRLFKELYDSIAQKEREIAIREFKAQKQIDETKQKSVISSDSTAFNIDDAMPSREDFIRDPNLYKKAVKKWGMSKVDQIIVKG